MRHDEVRPVRLFSPLRAARDGRAGDVRLALYRFSARLSLRSVSRVLFHFFLENISFFYEKIWIINQKLRTLSADDAKSLKKL